MHLASGSSPRVILQSARCLGAHIALLLKYIRSFLIKNWVFNVFMLIRKILKQIAFVSLNIMSLLWTWTYTSINITDALGVCHWFFDFFCIQCIRWPFNTLGCVHSKIRLMLSEQTKSGMPSAYGASSCSRMCPYGVIITHHSQCYSQSSSPTLYS